MPYPGIRLTLAAVALAQIAVVPSSASAELRLSTPEPEYRRLLSVDEQVAGKSQAGLAAAVAHFQASRFADCQQALKEAVERTPSLPPADLMLARMFLRTGNDGEAMRRLDRLAVEFSDHPEVFVSLGELALRQSRLTDAWLQLERAAGLKRPAGWDAFRTQSFRIELAQRQGEAAERREDWAAAERIYAIWSELDPKSAPAVLGRGRAQLGQKQPDAALASFRRARELDVQTPAAEALLGMIFARRGNTEQAGPWFEKAVADPDVTSATRLEYARWLLDQDRPDDAQVQLAAVPEGQVTDDAPRQFLCGLAARALGDLDAAEVAFSALQRANPLDWSAADQLALVLVERPDEAKRVRAAQLADANLKQSPDRATALATAGWVQLQLGDLQNGARLLEQSLQSGAPAPATRYYVSRLFAARGQTAEAAEWLRQALEAPTPWLERSRIAGRQKSAPATPADALPAQ